MQFKLKYPIIPATIGQVFGVNGAYYAQIGAKGHTGLDFKAFDGQEVYAAHDGIVTFTGYDGSGGLGVVIRTKEMFDYKDTQAFYKTIYWHLKVDSIVVKPDQEVHVGDLIAHADNTGFSTGTHLHFGLKPVYKGEQDWQYSNVEQINGFFGAIDPVPYFDGTYAHNPDHKYSFSKNLKFGDHDPEVKKLQVFLNDIGFPVSDTGDGSKGYETDYYGQKTSEAVLHWQLENKVDTVQKLIDYQGHYFGSKSRTKVRENY